MLDILDVLEVSVTPSPANRNAQLVSVKTEAKPKPRTEIQEFMERIDAPFQRGTVDPGAVDRLVTEVKLERAREKLAEAEQAAWEERMGMNVVLDPVPVRVDARMRPDR